MKRISNFILQILYFLKNISFLFKKRQIIKPQIQAKVIKMNIYVFEDKIKIEHILFCGGNHS